MKVQDCVKIGENVFPIEREMTAEEAYQFEHPIHPVPESPEIKELLMQATIDYNVMMGNLEDPNAEVMDNE